VAEQPLVPTFAACYGQVVAEPQDSRVEALQELAKRAKVLLSGIARALRRAALFRDALKLEKFQADLGRISAMFDEDTEKILVVDEEPSSGEDGASA
jgi:hypothetical protein